MIAGDLELSAPSQSDSELMPPANIEIRQCIDDS